MVHSGRLVQTLREGLIERGDNKLIAGSPEVSRGDNKTTCMMRAYDWVIEVSRRATEETREVAYENEEVRDQLLSFRLSLKPSFDALEGLSRS